MNSIFNLVTLTSEELLLNYPVELRIYFDVESEIDAEYEPRYNKKGVLKKHVIRIWMLELSRDIKALIAHELIHAWQEENEIEEIHGPLFQEWAEKLTNTFQIPHIYEPDIDK